ncbi:MAG TPA: hypothetical protein ENG60_02515 [Thermoplasmatales archaeon]|nr:hypothetical protein [Thermoplasmatales archaeon]HEX17269.1 hypothetical protein [Thermoplasmatales archaeon]
MRKVLIILVSLLIIFLTAHARASRAGVGVLNVPPTYRDIKIISYEGMTLAELTISDYNSWKDIWKVELIVRSPFREEARFVCYHYDSRESFDEVNRFEEVKGEDYLIKDLCEVKRSLYQNTVDQRCQINITFAFKPIPSSKNIVVKVYDRENAEATINVSYGKGVTQRNREIAIPFWTGEPIRISPDLPDILSLSTSITILTFIIRRWRR